MKDRTEENRTRQNYLLLLISMGLIGFGLIAVSVMNVLQQPFESALSNLLLLMGLAAISSLLLKVTPSFGSARFAYDVGSGLSIAALAYYGLSGAVLISTTIALTTWLLHQGRTHPSKRSYAQLIFNTGMLNIASFFAYLAFRGIVGQLDPNASLIVVGWIVAAVTYELANRAVLALIVQTTNVDGDGRSVFLAGGWTDTLLTMMINFVGAGLVGYAMKQHDWRGIVIFFIPVLLSSIAYLIHVRSAGVYMSQLEEMVQTRTQEREQVSREKDMFLRVLTHDMKTPLAVIRAYTQLLSRNPEFAVSKPKYLASLGSAEATLSRLVNDISELEVWSKGSKVVLKRVDTDLNKLMGRAVELISAESAAQKLIITSTPADGTPCAHIDPHHIERVLTNLLSNAVKYTPNGGSIHASIQVVECHVLITIEDTGYGIPEDELENIFRIFYRLSDHEELANGTGIGLATVKMLVEAHDGTIDVCSTVGVGSTFTITLPLNGA